MAKTNRKEEDKDLSIYRDPDALTGAEMAEGMLKDLGKCRPKQKRKQPKKKK